MTYTSPCHSQDLISNSPYLLTYISYDISLENLVLHQLAISSLIFFCILITCVLDIVLMLVAQGSLRVKLNMYHC